MVLVQISAGPSGCQPTKESCLHLKYCIRIRAHQGVLNCLMGLLTPSLVPLAAIESTV